MSGEQFDTPYDAGEELKRCLEVIEDESRRARSIAAGEDGMKSRGMIHVRFSGWDVDEWAWIRPEQVSYVEAPSERGGWYGYRWKCGGRIMDFSYFVGREACGDMEAVSDEERERRIAEVNLQWSMFYDQVVCGGIREGVFAADDDEVRRDV